MKGPSAHVYRPVFLVKYTVIFDNAVHSYCIYIAYYSSC